MLSRRNMSLCTNTIAFYTNDLAKKVVYSDIVTNQLYHFSLLLIAVRWKSKIKQIVKNGGTSHVKG